MMDVDFVVVVVVDDGMCRLSSSSDLVMAFQCWDDTTMDYTITVHHRTIAIMIVVIIKIFALAVVVVVAIP